MKKIIIAISSVIILFLLILFLFFLYISKKTSRPLFYFPNLVLKSINSPPPQDKLNLMILGLDRRNDWLEKTETTDTIIFSQINFSQSKIHLFSLPRDVWDYEIKTKINQIYPQSLKSPDKFTYISDKFSSISGQKINNIIILSTNDLKKLADILGGIDLYLNQGFKDEQYPNDAYIENPKSGAPIYKTIEFKSGWNHLDSQNITEFVRSRKSADTASNGGTDLGRIERQQQLINGLINKLKDSLSKKPSLVFDLYHFWSELEQNFTDQELIDMALKYGLNIRHLSIIRHPISAGEDPKSDLFYHPQKFINSQWVFIPQDQDFQAFKLYLSSSLEKP